MRSDASTLRRGVLRLGVLAALLVGGCSTLLGLESGKDQGACSSDDQCAPGYGCLRH